MENIIRKKLVMTGIDTDFVAVKQYENNYTRIVVEDFTPEEGYNYICVYKKLDHFGGCHRENVVYEVPFADNTIYVDNYITNELGTYLVAIVAINANDETIAIGSPFRIEVIKGVYTSNTQAPSLPEPLESKYQQLVTLIDEVTYKLETGAFKGEKGDKGEPGEPGKDYVITQEDYEAIAKVAEDDLQPQFDALGQAIADKMETYKVEVWNIGTADAFFEHIKADGTSERVDYNDLIEVYNNPRYFLYCEYPAVGLTLIPSLPPLDYDRILEFTCNWEYGGVPHQSRVIINENNQIKYDDRELALKDEIKVTDVKVNGESVVVDGVANVPLGGNDFGVVKANSNFGISMANGLPVINQIPDWLIDQRDTNTYAGYRAITGKGLDYAVKSALCDGKGQAYTEEEKRAVRERLGVNKLRKIAHIEIEQETNTFTIGNDTQGNPLHLSYVYIRTCTPKKTDTTADNGYFSFNNNYSILYGAMNLKGTNEKNYNDFEFFVGDIPYAIFGENVINGTIASRSSLSRNFGNRQDTPITEVNIIRWNGNGNMPIGTTFDIYGIDS